MKILREIAGSHSISFYDFDNKDEGSISISNNGLIQVAFSGDENEYHECLKRFMQVINHHGESSGWGIPPLDYIQYGRGNLETLDTVDGV